MVCIPCQQRISRSAREGTAFGSGVRDSQGVKSGPIRDHVLWMEIKSSFTGHSGGQRNKRHIRYNLVL